MVATCEDEADVPRRADEEAWDWMRSDLRSGGDNDEEDYVLDEEPTLRRAEGCNVGHGEDGSFVVEGEAHGGSERGEECVSESGAGRFGGDGSSRRRRNRDEDEAS